MALFSGRSNGHDIHRDVEALRREVAALSRIATKRGAAAWRGASDEASGLYDEVAERISHAMPVIRRAGDRGRRAPARQPPLIRGKDRDGKKNGRPGRPFSLILLPARVREPSGVRPA
jgi:hypothetical protein